tara:strand:- start:531 stop:1841 length:1311 start_codon:yes stop_codon:yes gene_type:complete
MSKNLKLAYWGAGGFIDLDSAYDKTTKAWAYNTISISFARLLIEEGNVQTNSNGTFKYFMEEWTDDSTKKTYSVGFGFPNNKLIGGKAEPNQNSVEQGIIMDSTLKRIMNGKLPKPDNLLLSLRDPLIGSLKGESNIDKDTLSSIAKNTQGIKGFVQAFHQLNVYYGNIFNGIDYDIELYNSKSLWYTSEDVSNFFNIFTSEFKQSNKGFIVTAAPYCGYTSAPYNSVKGIDHIIPQCYGSYKENNNCPDNPKGGLRGFKSWILNKTSTSYDDYKAVNNCITNSKGTSMWDLEWDVLGNETDDTAKAIRDCCKKTHGDTPGNLSECDNILSKYPRYTYTNNIQKDQLPSLAINLNESNIILPQMCQSSQPSITEIESINIKGNDLVINYKKNNPNPPTPICSGEFCPDVIIGAKCKDGENACCNTKGCYCNKDQCP